MTVQASWDMLQEGAQAPRLWSAEEPHLYILVLSLLGPQGDVIEAESTQVRTAQLPLLQMVGSRQQSMYILVLSLLSPRGDVIGAHITLVCNSTHGCCC